MYKIILNDSLIYSSDEYINKIYGVVVVRHFGSRSYK